MRRPVLLVTTLVLAVGAAAGWYGLRWFGGPRVTVAEVRRGPAVEAVYATANVEPVHWARVGPLETGRIMSLDVQEGQRVAAGDVLARQDTREEQARVAELEARERWLRSELERAVALARRGVASDQAQQRAQSELEQVHAGIAAAQQRLNRFVLHAPIDGVVLRRDREPGEVVRPGDTVFTIGQPSPLWAVADVDEQDIPLVVAGQTALIRADAFPGQVLEGRVAELTPLGDPVRQSYRVRIALPEDTPLRVGMTVETNIVVRRDDDAVLIPFAALVQGAGGSHVFVVEDGAARRRAVETGVIGDLTVEVRSGVAPGERVIVGPPATLADGTAVQVRDGTSGGAPGESTAAPGA